MNIALLGYGKMGKIIEQIATERGHKIVARVTSANQNELVSLTADVAIEFSNPEAAVNNLEACIKRNIPVVCGTTGWLDKKAEIESLTLQQDGTFFYASNFSVGVNIFFKINEQLARMVNEFPQYSVTIDEIHHKEKKDAPSGTAITLAQGIMKFLKKKTKWVLGTSEAENEIPIQSLRIDEVPGTHIIQYNSVIDSIELRHIAHSREGFARGAVLVAEWIKDKKGILTMDDFLKF